LLGCALAGALFVLQQRRFVARLGRLSAAGEGIAIAQTNAGCPALIGAWRPRIVLPADFEQRYSAAERELILAHERTHRRRGDVQANGLAALLRSAFWFNPLVHFAASRFRFDQELACDANVIARFPEARRTYADAMLKTQLAGAGLPVGCYWQSSQPHPLTERIAMLKQSSPGRTRIAFGTGLAALLALAGSYAAWAVQPATVGDAAPDVYQNARALDTAPASYPQAAIGARQQGKLVLKVQIDEHGDVRSAEVASADPPEAKAAFAESSIAAALHWKFDPASKNGKPVTSYAMVPIAFTLDDED
jgi:TonB family protein